MVEFAINNSVHASTTHTPFFVNGLRHPRLPTILECNYSLRVGDHSSERQIGSHSSRTDHEVTTYDADVDHIDFGEEEESKSEDALTTQVTDLTTVRFKRTTAKHSESADEFILARKTVVRFVQDSIAEAVDHQKKNADKNGKANVLSFNEEPSPNIYGKPTSTNSD